MTAHEKLMRIANNHQHSRLPIFDRTERDVAEHAEWQAARDLAAAGPELIAVLTHILTLMEIPHLWAGTTREIEITRIKAALARVRAIAEATDALESQKGD